ncbi:hypothetical protein [Flavobacterium sp.]|uniref:hypothetical protein n=1 Tax=Flavobacterium sp. TaxID=239 RepID=UPI003BE81C40
MKKTIYILSISFLLLQACSSSDNNASNSTNLILLKKTIYTNPDGVFTTNFTYNGNKIIKAITNNFGYSNFIYSGDLVSSVENYDINNNLTSKSLYNYNSNNEISNFIELNYSSNIGHRIVYQYNSDGTVLSNQYTGNLNTQTTLSYTCKIYFSNGEVSSEVFSYGSTKTINFTYDNKNQQNKNVIGFDKLSFAVYGPFVAQKHHNIIQSVQFDNGSQTFLKQYQIQYNSDDYPVSKTITTNNLTDESLQLFY